MNSTNKKFTGELVNSSNDDKNALMKLSITLIVVTGLFVLVYLCLLLFQGQVSLSRIDMQKAGVSGDFISGYTGVFIGISSCLLLFLNLRKFNEQVLQSKIDAKNNIELINEQNKSSEFYSLLSGLNDVIVDVDKCVDRIIDQLNADKERIASSRVRKKSITSNSVYLSAFYENEDVGKFIRYCHRLMKFVASIHDEKCRMRYAKLFRSVLNQKHLIILHYNSRSALGNKQKGYISEFAICKHLNILNLLEFSDIAKKNNLTKVQIGFLGMFASEMWQAFIKYLDDGKYSYITVYKGAYGFEVSYDEEFILIKGHLSKDLVDEKKRYPQIGFGIELMNLDEIASFIHRIFWFEINRYVEIGKEKGVEYVLERNSGRANKEKFLLKIALRRDGMKWHNSSVNPMARSFRRSFAPGGNSA
jgi:hypothetical protein